MLEFVAKLFIAFVEVKGIPVLALPVEMKADGGKLRRDKYDLARVQGSHAGLEIGCDLTIVGSMSQLPLDDNGVGQQQRGEGGCNYRPPPPAQ